MFVYNNKNCPTDYLSSCRTDKSASGLRYTEHNNVLPVHTHVESNKGIYYADFSVNSATCFMLSNMQLLNLFYDVVVTIVIAS